MDKMKPMQALAKAFRDTAPIAEFASEINALKASCPAQTEGRVTSFKDFVTEVGAYLGVEIDFA